jgi:hypothetical protein
MSRYRETDRAKGRYKPARYNVKDQRAGLADMSVPPEERGRRARKRVKVVGGTPPAQLGHGRGPKADKYRRDMERKKQRR